MPVPPNSPPDASHADARKRPIIGGAIAFVILVCISLIAVEAWSRWNARAVQLSEKRIATSNMARALARHAENTFKLADTVLVGMVERLETDDGGASFDRMQKLLALHVAELPLLHGLFIFGEDGRQFVNSQPRRVNNVDGSSREYFIYHRSHPDRGPHIGPPVRSPSTGDWIITVSRRVNDAKGAFAGVVVATIKLEHFKRAYDSFDIGQKGAILLALDDGVLLVRRAANEATNRSNIADGPVFREYRANGPVGTAMLTARADNVERLYSYRRLDAYPLIVAVALSKEEILDNWWADTCRNFTGIAVLAAVLGLLGYRLIRQIRIRERLAAQLRAAKHALEALNGSLKTQALHDGLTGLANRRHFETALDSEFGRAMRNGTSLALVMLDVDHFKKYNDIYGHPAGDECLRKVSEAVKSAHHRAGDLTARYGGEELAVLLPGTDLRGAMAVAEKIRLAVSGLNIPHPANPAGIVTISAGVQACMPVMGGNAAADLVQAADQALYAAKSNGRDHVCCNAKLTPA